MLKRVYIDNYRSLVNFDFRPKPVQLIYGTNGSGKTSLLDALVGLRSFVVESQTAFPSFPVGNRTRWIEETKPQTFRVEVDVSGYQLEYELVLERVTPFVQRVTSEVLTEQGRELLVFRDGNVKVWQDDYGVAVSYTHDWARSALGAVLPRQENAKIAAFRGWLETLYVVNIVPMDMVSRAESNVTHLGRHAHNFASWYMHLSLEQMDDVTDLRQDLREVLPELDSLMLKQAGETWRTLVTRFRAPDGKQPVTFDLTDLSDGQRALIVLYTLLRCAMKPGRTLCFDEPDNYLALSEIQPWLAALQRRVQENGGQALIVSHHPEVLNQLAAESGVQFVRRGSGAVTVEPYASTSGGVLAPSEEIARDGRS